MNISFLLNVLFAKFTFKQKNEWLFTSFYGDYSDSPKVISELLHQKHPEINIKWILKDGVKDVPDYVVKVKLGTMEADKARHSASVIVDNIYGENAFSTAPSIFNKLRVCILLWLRKSKGQKIYSTWHGIPLKRLGRDEVISNLDSFISNDVTMFVNSKFEEDVMRHVTFDKIKMFRLGMPRNDVLFDPEKATEIRFKLGIKEETKILLYAPTFRRDPGGITEDNLRMSGLAQLDNIDFGQLKQCLTVKFGGEWVFVFRLHSQVSEKVNWDELSVKTKGAVINGNLFSDMAEYLACADILVTDASSCMFDFMLTRRPCFLLFPDVEHYQNSERGFYMPVESLPFPLAKSAGELLEEIVNFDEIKYRECVQSLINEMEIIDDGKSGERVLDAILNDVGI